MCENRIGIKMLRILLTVTLVTLVAGYGVLTPKFEWNGGFQASISLRVNQTYHGWCIHIVFDEPLQAIEIWTATLQNITCQGGREFVARNQEFDTDLQKGTTLDMDIVGRTSHSNFVVGKVYLAHQCSGCRYSGSVRCEDQLSDCQDLQQRVNICSSHESAEKLCPMTCGICTTPLHLTSVPTGCKDQLDDCQNLQQRVNICSDLASAQNLCPMTCGICTTKPIPLTTTTIATTSTQDSKTTATSRTTALPTKPTTTSTTTTLPSKSTKTSTISTITTLPSKPATTSTATQLPSKTTTTSTTTTLPSKSTTTSTTSTTTTLPSKPTKTSTISTTLPSKPATTSTTTTLPTKPTTTSTTTTLPSKTTVSSATTKSSSHVLELSSTSLACSDKVNSCRDYFDHIPCTDQRFLSWAKQYCAATCSFC